jgi:hypothetical protein
MAYELLAYEELHISSNALCIHLNSGLKTHLKG